MDSPIQNNIASTFFGDENKFIADVIALGNTAGRDLIITINDKPHDVSDLNAYNPYLGLKAFTYADRPLYAGRNDEIQRAVDCVATPGQTRSILFITGASGSGKSSFVQAGVVPKIEQFYLNKTVKYHVIRPSLNPVAQLLDALKRLGLTPPAELTPQTWHSTLQATPLDQINILIIDQFEELFTQTTNPQDKTLVIELLTTMPPFEECRTHILATVRVDYLPAILDESPSLYKLATEQGIALAPMNDDELRQAIQQPLVWFRNQFATINHKAFEFALLTELLTDTKDFNQNRDNRDAYLPLLQVTLYDLWNRGSLTRGAYTSLTSGLQTHADDVYGYTKNMQGDRMARSPQQQTLMMEMLLALVDVSLDDDARRDVRKRRTLDDLTPTSERHQLVRELTAARLLSTSTEVHGGKTVRVVDIIHESLIRNWTMLADAIKNQRTSLQRRQRFENALAEWVQNGRDPKEYLLTGVRLAEAEEFLKLGHTATNNDDARALIRQSRDTQVKEQAEKQRREFEAQNEKVKGEMTQYKLKNEQLRTKNRNRMIAGIVVLLIIVAGAALTFLFQRDEIGVLKARSESTSDLQALIFQSQNDIAPFDQFLLRYEAAKRIVALTDESLTDQEKNSRRLLEQQAFRLLAGWFQNNILPSAVLSDTTLVRTVAWSPDGKYIVTGSDDLTLDETLTANAVVWNVSDGTRAHTLGGHLLTIWDVAWSPDSKRIVTASGDGTARIWNVATEKELFRLQGKHTQGLVKVAWSPDGSKIATASPDMTVTIWNPTDGQPTRTLTHTASIRALAWSPDGQKLITTAENATATIWNATTGEKEIQQLQGFKDIAPDVAWSPNGKYIATTSSAFTRSGFVVTRIWNANNGTLINALEGHRAVVRSVAWNADSTTLVTTSDDQTAQLWTVATNVTTSTTNLNDNVPFLYGPDSVATEVATRTATLVGHTNSVWDAAWSPDGRSVVTASLDGTANIWHLQNSLLLQTLRGHTDNVWGVAWNPKNEQQVATVSRDHAVNIWDITTGISETLFNGKHGIWKVAWNSDGSKIAVASDDQTARVWNADGTALITFTGHLTTVKNLAWSPDSQKLVTVSKNMTVIIWSINNATEPITLTGHTNFVWGVAWSHDGNTIATASEDKTVRIWDAVQGTQTQVITFPDKVWDVAWNAKDTRLAIGASHTVKIWDVSKPPELDQMLTMQGITNVARSIGWSPDDQRIIVGAHDNTAKIWDANDGTYLASIIGHTDLVWDAAWNPAGTQVIVGSSDKTADIWCMPAKLSDLVHFIEQRLPANMPTNYPARNVYVSGILNETAFTIDSPPLPATAQVCPIQR